MEAPTKGKPFTSSSSARAEEYEDDEEESLVGSNEILFGTNEGQVELPMIWSLVTHPPEGDDNRRTKRVHILMQMLSGTDAKTGYAVDHEPKSNELVFVLQKGNEEVMWGDSGRVVIKDRFASDSMKMNSAEATNNFTEIPQQIQRLKFPFTLDRVLKKQPFFVKVNNGPAGNYLGLYVVAKIDWDDKEEASAGDDFYEVQSPLSYATKTAKFYDNKSSVNPSKPAPPPTAAFHGEPSASEEEGLSDRAMLKLLLQKMNLQGEDIHFDNNIARTSNITPRSVKQKKKSVVAKKPSGTNLVNHFLSSTSKKTTATENTSGDEDDDISYGNDESVEVEEIYTDK